MPSEYYRDALKRAQKEFRSCTAKGESPYLPVLDEFVSQEDLLRTVDLGTIQVPLEFVVGTQTDGRTQAFARNFMPLMEEESEFAFKWKKLCQSQLEEGIRDPISAYEYLNRYYVTEGNKRVSVLKYFEADSIYAHVTRILPKRTDSRESELYYELIDFYRCSRINFIEFSKPGSYIRLQELVGKRVGDPWTDEERSGFSTAYYYFRRAYEDNGGRRLTSTVGDAMLAYMEIYGYPSLRGVSGEEIRRAVARAWEEITLQQEEEPIDVKLTPEEETRKRDLLSKMLPKAAPKPLKVAFLHDKAPETSGWTYGHELGRRHLETVFAGQVETCAYCNALDGDPLVVMEQAIQEGCRVLFTTSPRLLPSSLRAAVDHPEALILNCSLNTSHRYIRTYYARMYEVKFISGAIAGALAGGDSIGYVGDYPIFGQVASINAFALGVQLTNPRTRVYLEWSSVSSGETAVQRLTDRGIRLISAQDLTKLGAGRTAASASPWWGRTAR